VTTTPRLIGSILRRAEQVGVSHLCVGVLATGGDPAVLMAAPRELERALHTLAERAAVDLGAQAIIVGGGPLARVARALRGRLQVPVIEPIPEAVRSLTATLAAATR
jgi:allantoin racemase